MIAALFWPCAVGPPAGYPSDGRGFKNHTLWDCDPFHNAVERTAASGSFEFAFHRCDNRSQSGHYDRIFLAERMYNGPGAIILQLSASGLLRRSHKFTCFAA